MDGDGGSGPDDWLHSTSRIRQTILPLAQLESTTWKTFLPSARRQSSTLGRKLADDVGRLDIWIDFLESCDKQALDQIPETTENLVLKLVFRIGRSLCDLHATALKDASRSATLAAHELKEHLDEKVQRLVSEGDSEDEEDNDSSDSASDSGSATSDVSQDGVEQLAASLATTVSCLTRLIPVLETACIQALSERQVKYAPIATVFEPHGPADHFIRLIIDRFNRVDLDLANRLGEANWQRQERVRISSSSTGYVGDESLAHHLNIDQQSLFKPSSTFRDSALGTSLAASILPETNSADIASLFSSTSTKTGTSVRAPPTPKEVALGKPFECFICHETLRGIKSRSQWKYHVFEDLQPYICCRKFCTDYHVTFLSRQDWMAHDNSKHSNETADAECPLCHKACAAAGKDYARHMGRHLEAIALLAMPPRADDDDDSDTAYESDYSTRTIPRRRRSVSPRRTETSRSEKLEAENANPDDFEPNPHQTTYQGNGELDKALEHLKANLGDWKVKALGKLILYGTHLVTQDGLTFSEQECKIFLFERSLLCCEDTATKPRLDLKSTIFLPYIVDIDTRSDSDGFYCGIVWGEDGRFPSLELQCETQAEATRWRTQIEIQMQRLDEAHPDKLSNRLNASTDSSGISAQTPQSDRPQALQSEQVNYKNSDLVIDNERATQIRCICGFTDDDDGRIILCDKCVTWQHISCYFYPDNRVFNVFDHVCVICKPRSPPLDAASARNRQQERYDLDVRTPLKGLHPRAVRGKKHSSVLHVGPKQITPADSKGTATKSLRKPDLVAKAVKKYLEKRRETEVGNSSLISQIDDFLSGMRSKPSDNNAMITRLKEVFQDDVELLEGFETMIRVEDASTLNLILGDISDLSEVGIPRTFSCHQCQKKFTRAYDLRSHLRTHLDLRPYVCAVCLRSFARKHDCKRHEGVHAPKKDFVCKGVLKSGSAWGCGQQFGRVDSLRRHVHSEKGRDCIKPLLVEEAKERRAATAGHTSLGLSSEGVKLPHISGKLPEHFTLPPALLQQYPALTGMQLNTVAEGEPDGDPSVGTDDLAWNKVSTAVSHNTRDNPDSFRPGHDTVAVEADIRHDSKPPGKRPRPEAR